MKFEKKNLRCAYINIMALTQIVKTKKINDFFKNREKRIRSEGFSTGEDTNDFETDAKKNRKISAPRGS